MANIEKASLDGTNYDLGPDTIDASNITGTLPIANGGTGQTTKAAVRNTLGLGNTTGALPVANGGTGCTSVTDKFISVEVRYPSSGNYNFTSAGPFYPSGSIPAGYVALLCSQVSTNGFVGSAYATENVYGKTGADVMNNIAFWLQFTGTGYLLMRVLCVKA